MLITRNFHQSGVELKVWYSIRLYNILKIFFSRSVPQFTWQVKILVKDEAFKKKYSIGKIVFFYLNPHMSNLFQNWLILKLSLAIFNFFYFYWVWERPISTFFYWFRELSPKRQYRWGNIVLAIFPSQSPLVNLWILWADAIHKVGR